MAIVRRFQIEVLGPRTITETVYTKVKHEGMKTSSLQPETVERVVEKSYMVYFPAGHCVWFEDKASMARAGVIESANVEIDDVTGMPASIDKTVDFKAIIEARATANRMPRRA